MHRILATAGRARVSNVEQNAQHYDAVYRRVRVDHVVEKLRNIHSFLDDAIATDTSWHGMYYGGFRERLAGRRVLELGCGDGTNALAMAALGAEVVAVDISGESERIIREAAERVGLDVARIRPVTGDFVQLDFEDSTFDYVVGKAFLHHLTVDLEVEYLEKVARLLKPMGEARFFEPATNSRLLEWIRWRVPVPGRPSKLRRRRFAAWKAQDPHPDRGNDSAGYVDRARQWFAEVEVIPIGSIERLHRLLPSGTWNRRFRRWAHRADPKLPREFRLRFARSQTLVYRNPYAPAHAVERVSDGWLRPVDLEASAVALARRPAG